MVRQYQVVLKETSLEAEITPFQADLHDLHTTIGCTTLDHTNAIDLLRDCRVDMWIDDTGLLTNRNPVMVFVDAYGLFRGEIVGTIVFQKHDGNGTSIGMTKEEADAVVSYLGAHYKVTRQDDDGNEYSFYVIDPRESEKHRQDIEALINWALDNGYHIM